jgi:hypothetical protein
MHRELRRQVPLRPLLLLSASVACLGGCASQIEGTPAIVAASITSIQRGPSGYVVNYTIASSVDIEINYCGTVVQRKVLAEWVPIDMGQCLDIWVQTVDKQVSLLTSPLPLSAGDSVRIVPSFVDASHSAPGRVINVLDHLMLGEPSDVEVVPM